MQVKHEIFEKQEAVRKIKQNGDQLSRVNSILKSDISFAWAIYHIKSEMKDDFRIKYIQGFMIKESLKLCASLATVIIMGCFMSGQIYLPIPFLVVVTLGSLLAAISGFYSIHKITQHSKGFFNGFKNIKTSEIATTKNQVQVLNRLQRKCYGQEIGQFLNDSELQQLTLGDKTIHLRFYPKKILNKFLQCVAFGKQDQVDQLFNEVFSGNPAKIQEALRFQGKFTDYTGRTFNCSAYEYAYWAKDIHMCRMLERYMDEGTKAFILARINTNDEAGLPYQQNSEEYRSAHFDLTPLKDALQAYVAGVAAWFAARNRDAMDAAWLAVGLAQRDVPAHVAQEYCRPDRAFYPCPDFNEASFSRVLRFSYYPADLFLPTWFPTPRMNGLGFDLTAVRGGLWGGVYRAKIRANLLFCRF